MESHFTFSRLMGSVGWVYRSTIVSLINMIRNLNSILGNEGKQTEMMFIEVLRHLEFSNLIARLRKNQEVW